MSKNHFEIEYKGPFKGIHTSLPEDVIPKEYSPNMVNFILKNGEIRSRPRQYFRLPGPPDNLPIQVITSFLDANNVTHTVAVTPRGLYQLNRLWQKNPITAQKSWSLIGAYPVQPGPFVPAASSVFVNKFFWTNGGSNLWMWDGITSIGAPSIWGTSKVFQKGTLIQDSNGNIQIAGNSGTTDTIEPTWAAVIGGQTTDNDITWTENGKPAPSNGFSGVAVVDATNGITAGAFFLIELNAQLLMLNTVENGQSFPQRVRWCPSGIPTIWDPNVNIGAGFNDELDVPDGITGAMTVGTTAFIYRTNGITEVTSTGNGINPFNFNHLWASDRGIGNVLPFGYASYGPLGIFVSSDDIYNVSLGGFKKIGGVARDSIFNDLGLATGIPIASIVPYIQTNYIYNQYRLAIPIGRDMKTWVYSIEDDSWQPEFKRNVNPTGIARWSYIG